MVDRDGVAVDIVLNTEGAAMRGLARGVMSPRLSAIVLGPLMIVYV
jgi:hypothetical protein